VQALDRLFNLTGWRGAFVLLIIGALGVLGHAPFHIWPITIIVFALLFRALTLTDTPKRGFRTALWFGLGYFMGNVYWIGAAFIVRGPEFIPAMPPMIDGSPAPFLSLAGLFFLAEFARGHFLGGFPWNLPGYIFKGGESMSQSASLFGIYGLSLCVFLCAALLARFLWNKDRLSLLIAGVLLAANFAFGYLRLQNTELTYEPGVVLRIAHVPVDQSAKMTDPEVAVEIIREFLRVSIEPGAENVTHLVWPEGASDGVAIDNIGLRQAVENTLLSVDTSPPVWLMNSLRVEDNPESAYGFDYFNTSAAIVFDGTPGGRVAALNDKRNLVPFGEFIPGGKVVEDIGAKLISSSLGSITRAPAKTPTNFPGLPLGSSQICYEVGFSGLTPRPKDGKRVNWILNQSNDAWFGASVGPHQHANISRYRAIEEKIPVIRAASNGYSGIIDPYGRFTTSAGPSERVAIDAKLPQPIGESLPFNKINWLTSLLIIFLTYISLSRNRRRPLR